AVSHIDSKHYVKVNLIGTYLLGAQKDLHHLLIDFSPMFYSFTLSDKSTLKINIEDYKYDISLKGEFIRSVLKSHLPQKQKEDVINFGIRALRGEEIFQ
ncbi:MAG TPA: DNA repair exonuclease, partial [Clostridia bacterium]